jgi:alkanesulfonate monooxygenase
MIEPQMGASYDQQLRVAQRAEADGYDAFFRSDHFLAFGGAEGLPGPTDAWITLAGIARETSRIRLGTLLTSATFRAPGVLAVSVAQVDEMSAGRVELGLGAGWFEEEHQSLGIDFPPLAVRFDRLEEQLELLSGLWALPPGERYSFAGAHYVVEGSPGLPRPRQSPRPPIIVGGMGPRRTPGLAARFADEFNTPFLQPDDARAAYGRVDAACEAIGRDPASVRHSAAVTVCCGADEAELARRAGRIGQELEHLRRFGAAGIPVELAERLEQYRSAGAETIYLQVLDLDDLDHLSLIAAEVAPLLG